MSNQRKRQNFNNQHYEIDPMLLSTQTDNMYDVQNKIDVY